MSRWRSLPVFVAAFVLICAGLSVAAQEARPGQLAVVGADGNLSVIAPDGALNALTSDAGRSGDRLRFYQWPTWFRSGGLAFFATELSQQGGRALEMWATNGASTPSLIYRAPDVTFTYAYASPQPCPDATPCAPVAALLSGASPDGFDLALIPTDGSDAQVAGQGAPFYFDWSPDGAQMAWHRNDSRLDLYSLAQNAVIGALAEQPGQFTAPAFSPAGDGALLLGVWDEATQTTSLVVQRGDARTTIARGLTHPAAFAWSPDGRQIAWSDRIGPLVVSDAATGDELARTPSTTTIAFFWSPVGGRIAYLTLDAPPPGSFSAKRAGAPAQQPMSSRLVWNLLTVADGSIQRAASFVPTDEQAYLLGFFDQFALSHRVWSPDGTRIVYAELVTPTQPVVEVLDVSGPQPEVTTAGPGVLGVWSFQ